MTFNVRHIIAFLLVISVIVIVYARMCLNLTMVAMTYRDISMDSPNHTIEICPLPDNYDDDDEPVTPVPLTTTGTQNRSSSAVQDDGVLIQYPTSSEMGIWNRLRNRKYHWSQQTQGQILGCYYWSYFVFMMITGLLAQKYGGRWIISFSVLFSGVLSLCTPFITDFVWLFILCRVALGALQAGLFPAAYQTISQWIPVNKRSVTFAFLEIGTFIGAIISFQTTGPIYNAWGWPSAFFIPGLCCIVVFFFVISLLRNNPSDCSFISERELKLIRQDIDPIPSGKKLKDTPFRKIIFCKAVWAAALFKFQSFWNVIIISTKVPSYMSGIIHVDLTTSGQINAVVCLLNGLVLALAGFVSERVILKGYLSRTNTRKAFSLISGVLNGVMIFSVPYAGCNVILIRCILFSQAICSGFTAASDVPLAAEMTFNYPAFCYSFINTAGMLGGFLAPWLSGVVLDLFADKWLAWCIIFRYCGIQSFVVTLIFLLFASAERQDFDRTPEELEIRRQISKNKEKKEKEPEEDDRSARFFHEYAAHRASSMAFQQL